MILDWNKRRGVLNRQSSIRERLVMRRIKGEKDLRVQMEDLRLRPGEAMDIVRAIRSGEVDALVVSTPQGNQVYTLEGG